MRVKAAPEQLEDEDVLEMVSAGLVPIAIVDSHNDAASLREPAEVRKAGT